MLWPYRVIPSVRWISFRRILHADVAVGTVDTDRSTEKMSVWVCHNRQRQFFFFKNKIYVFFGTKTNQERLDENWVSTCARVCVTGLASSNFWLYSGRNMRCTNSNDCSDSGGEEYDDWAQQQCGGGKESERHIEPNRHSSKRYVERNNYKFVNHFFLLLQISLLLSLSLFVSMAVPTKLIYAPNVLWRRDKFLAGWFYVLLSPSSSQFVIRSMYAYRAMCMACIRNYTAGDE